MTAESAALAPLVERLGSAALFFDFDGSLAPIVTRPADARPLPASVAAIRRLAERCPVVAVVSGRPLAFLEPWFPAPVRLAGLYGLERRVEGCAEEHPDATRWRRVVADVAHRAEHLPPAVLAEDKGLSLTLHYRTAPELADVVSRWAHNEAARSGLEARPAKMSVELHPPVHIDKGVVVTGWAAGAAAVLFAGDDAGDLPAFAALGALRAAGTCTLAVAVASPEMPQAVRHAADLIVEGPPGLARLLETLAAAP
jgi:trehalose 6-phosphate phosphatase